MKRSSPRRAAGHCRVKLAHVSDPSLYGNPLALGYLKTYADSVLGPKADIRITECPKEWGEDELPGICSELLSGKPDIIGFSCYLWNTLAVIALSRALKKRSPSTLIVLGGPDASARGARILKESGADALVLGEGELTFADLLARYLEGTDWAGTPGTIIPSKGRLVKGPARPLIEDLDIIPSPYLAGLFDGKSYKFIVFETSRGCPFNCSFCVWTSKGKIRRFSAERSKREIDWINRTAASEMSRRGRSAPMHVFLADQDLTMDERRGVDILNYVRSTINPEDLVWIIECDIRFWTKKIAVAGNFKGASFCFGIQSLNRKVVEATGRHPLTKEEMMRHLYIAKEFSPKAFFLLQLMLGLPGDDMRSFIESLGWCLNVSAEMQTAPVISGSPERLRPLLPYFETYFMTGVQVFPVSVFPGTRLEEEAGKAGVVWDKNPPYYVRSTKEFPSEDIRHCIGVLKMLQDFTASTYSRPTVQLTLDEGKGLGDPR